MVRSVLVLFIIATTFCCSTSFAQPPLKPPSSSRQVRVEDPEGKPVAGALVQAWLLNEKYFWSESFGPNDPIETDGNGVASITYPKLDFISSLTMTVSHPDYLTERIVVSVLGSIEKPFAAKMKPGVELILHGVDELGALKEPFAVMTSREETMGMWKRPRPDIASSRSLPDGITQIMLVQPKPDGRHLFSDVVLQSLNRAKTPSVEVHETLLSPGARVTGKLSPQVPRPVKNGFVISVSIPLPSGDSSDQNLPSLLYYDSADLKADGTFEFLSLPFGGVVQLIAVCDGWVGLQSQNQPFVVGETFDVEDESLDVELEMEPTFDAKIRVIDQKGRPVSGITVSTTPNQLYQKGGSTFLGIRPSSMDGLKNQLTKAQPKNPQKRWDRYSGTSDQDGRLTISNLPRNRISAHLMVSGGKPNMTLVDNSRPAGKLPDSDQSEVDIELVVTPDD